MSAGCEDVFPNAIALTQDRTYGKKERHFLSVNFTMLKERLINLLKPRSPTTCMRQSDPSPTIVEPVPYKDQPLGNT